MKALAYRNYIDGQGGYVKFCNCKTCRETWRQHGKEVVPVHEKITYGDGERAVKDITEEEWFTRVVYGEQQQMGCQTAAGLQSLFRMIDQRLQAIEEKVGYERKEDHKR